MLLLQSIKMLRTLFAVLLIICIVFMAFLISSQNRSSQYPQNQSFEKSQATKYILFWNKAGKSDRLYFPSSGREIFETCKIKDCFATSDRNLLPIEDFDAIIFHSPKTGQKQEESLPERRRPEQRYIFAAFEAPSRFFVNRSRYVLEDFYNWTMTYRFDSDLVRRHGYVEKGAVEYEMPSREFVRGKDRMVAWMVSNCNTPGKREVLAKELSKYVDVDVYGKCGNFFCDKSIKNNCLEMLEHKYKYYLSFENSHCKDYTTEKFYDILNRNIIPVVYGGGDYEEIAPAKSYINVEDFLDVKHLAEYLKAIAADEGKYLEYFQWKKHYFVYKKASKTMCKLCEKLHKPNEKKKTYYDINKWWFHASNSRCTTGFGLPPIVRNLLRM